MRGPIQPGKYREGREKRLIKEGAFSGDRKAAEVIKHNGQFQVADLNSLVTRNENLRNLMAKKKVVEVKMIDATHNMRVLGDVIIKD